MTPWDYWDTIRVAEIAILVPLIVTMIVRYRTGVQMLDPRHFLEDPSHLPLLRMGHILLFAALVEGYIEGLVTGLPGGPRVIGPMPGLLLILLSAHWGRVYRTADRVRAWWRRRRPRA